MSGVLIVVSYVLFGLGVGQGLIPYCAFWFSNPILELKKSGFYLSALFLLMAVVAKYLAS